MENKTSRMWFNLADFRTTSVKSCLKIIIREELEMKLLQIRQQQQQQLSGV